MVLLENGLVGSYNIRMVTSGIPEQFFFDGRS